MRFSPKTIDVYVNDTLGEKPLLIDTANPECLTISNQFFNLNHFNRLKKKVLT